MAQRQAPAGPLPLPACGDRQPLLLRLLHLHETKLPTKPGKEKQKRAAPASLRSRANSWLAAKKTRAKRRRARTPSPCHGRPASSSPTPSQQLPSCSPRSSRSSRPGRPVAAPARTPRAPRTPPQRERPPPRTLGALHDPKTLHEVSLFDLRGSPLSEVVRGPGPIERRLCGCRLLKAKSQQDLLRRRGTV